jgi:hypothetical protein
MLRGLRTRGILFEALGLASLFAVLSVTIEISPLIQILNAVFVGVFVASIPPFWHIIVEQFKNADTYQREHQFSLGIWLLWIGALMNRIISIVARAVQGEKALVSDTVFTAASIYILIVAGLLQVTAISQSSIDTSRDRKFLIRSAIIGVMVTVILIVVQAVGTKWGLIEWFGDIDHSNAFLKLF